MNNYCRNLMKGWVDSEIPKKLSFHQQCFNTHQNEIPTPTPIKNKEPLNMHVCICIDLFILIYVFSIHIYACMYIQAYLCMYTDEWIDG